MAVKDLDTPLHRLMEYLEAGEYARLAKEFTDFVKEDFYERVRLVQMYSKEKRVYVFLKSFIDKVRRKQYSTAQEHLRAARKEYEKFMLQYESLPPRKKPLAIKPYPQPKDNERKPAVIPNEETRPGYWAPQIAKSSPQPVYSPPPPQYIKSQLRPETNPRTEIEERLQPPIEPPIEAPIEAKPERPEPDKKSPIRAAIIGAEEAIPKQVEKERKIQREPLPVTKPDEAKLITSEKHVQEIKPKASSHDESQDEVLPWMPAPEDVRPNFTNGEDNHDRKIKIDTLNRYSPHIHDSHLYSNVYDAYKRSLDTSVLLRDSKLHMADLYHPLRPSKLTERFFNLYFEEYARAFEELMQCGMKERNIIFYLLQIVTKAYEHCQAAVELNLNQNRNLREEILRRSGIYGVNTTEFHVHRNSQIEQRRIKATQLLPYAREDFLQAKYPRILPRKIVTECLRAITYAEKSMEICWWMRILEPPIAMEWVPDRDQSQSFQPFNRDLYGPYTKAGSHLEYTVWPALRLYKHGPVLSKGIAQGINLYVNSVI